MKKILFLLLAAVLSLTQNLQAQDSDYVTVGDETSSVTAYAPVRFNYNNCYTQTLYLAEELQAGDISIVSYFFNGEAESAPMTLYMAEVPSSKTSFSSNTDFVALGDLTQVYSGTFTFQPGWNAIVLDDAFSYSGEGNLVVACLSNGRNWVGRTFKGTSFTASRTITLYSDSYAPDPAAVATYAGSKGIASDVPNTVFYFGAPDDFCYAPAGSITFTGITSEAATVNWTADESSTTFGLEYRVQGQEEWIIADDAISDTQYELTGLDPYTHYDVKVYSVCGNGNSGAIAATLLTNLADDQYITLPYANNFNDGEMPEKWFVQNSTVNPWVFGTAVNNEHDDNGEPVEGGALYVSNDEGVSNSYTIDASATSYAYCFVNFEEGSSYGLEFDYRGVGQMSSYGYAYDFARVYLLPIDYELTSSEPASRYAITPVLNQIADWQRTSVTIPDSCIGHSYRLTFMWKNNDYTGSMPAGAIDNLNIIATSCARVSDIAVAFTDEGSSVSAEVTMTDENEGATYLLEYKASGDTTWTSETATSPITLNGLAYATSYQMRATAICSGEDSAIVSDVFTFTAPCGIYQTPFAEYFSDFSAITSSTTGCWKLAKGFLSDVQSGSSSALTYGSSSWTNSDISTVFDGTAHVKINIYKTSATGSDKKDWLITPVIDLGDGSTSYDLKFDLAFSKYGYSSVSSPISCIGQKFAVLVSTDDGATWNAHDALTWDSTSEDQTTNRLDLVPYTGERMSVNLTELGYTGPVMLAFYAEQTQYVSGQDNDLHLDNVMVVEHVDCGDILSIVADAHSATSVALSWPVNENITDGYRVAYAEGTSVNVNDTENTIFLDVPNATEFPYIVDGLNEAGVYTFTVQYDCGGGWAAPQTVELPSSPAEIPYTCNFEDSEENSKWEIANGTHASKWYIGAETATPDEHKLYVSKDNGATLSYNTTGGNVVYATRLIQFDNANAYKISFDYKGGGEGTWDYVKVGLFDFNEEFTASTTTPSWVYSTAIQPAFIYQGEVKFNLAPETARGEIIVIGDSVNNSVKKLVFAWRQDYSGGDEIGVQIDNISIETLGCSAPTDIVLAEDGATTNSLTFDILASTGDAWEIQYRVYGAEEYETFETTSLTGNTISDLIPGTMYEVRVRSICSGESSWFIPANTDAGKQFATACDVVTIGEDTPFVENFDSPTWFRDNDITSNDKTAPMCWININGGYSSYSWSHSTYVGDSYNGSAGSLYAYSNTSSGDSDLSDWFITPILELTGSDILSFMAKRGNADETLKVMAFNVDENGDMTSAADTVNFTELTTLAITQTEYSPFDVPLTDLQGQYRLAFCLGACANYLRIDDVTVAVTTCTRPQTADISVMAFATSATVTINDESNTAWKIFYKESSAEEFTEIPTTETRTQLTDLTPITDYEFYVVGDCGSSVSQPSATFEFTTTCFDDPISEFPYTEGFENGLACWQVSSSSTTYKWTAVSSGGSPSCNPHGGSKMAKYQCYNVSAGNTTTMISPVFDFSEDMMLSYWIYRMNNTSYRDKLYVYVNSTPSLEGATLLDTTLVETSNASAWEKREVFIPSDLMGTQYLIFHAVSAYGYNMYVDDISVMPVPSCTSPAASSVVASGITTTSATISWTDENENNSAWNVYYRPLGSEEEFVVLPASEQSVELNDLEISQTYEVYVKTDCGSEESAPTDIITFTTFQEAESIPYTCDFEGEGNNGWLLKNGTCTNQWHVGTPTGSTSGGELYISNDNGTSSAYDINSSSTVIAEKLFQTGTSDSLTISFDLTVGGEYDYDYYDDYYDYYDYLKVFFVPADTVYEPSTEGTYFSRSWYDANTIMSNSYYGDYVLCELSGTQNMSVTIPNPNNELKKLVFVWRNDSSGGTQQGAVIDNVSVVAAGETTEPEPCDAPTDLAVSAITQTGATVTWNGSASSYEVRLNGGTAETVTATTKTYTELTAGTSYTVEVRSLCESNNSAWVSTTFTTLDDEVIVTPPTVATLAATNVTHNGATLNGTITAGSETITAQGFMYKTSAAADWTTVNASGTTISTTLSNLTAETAYDFKAFATTASGTVEGTVMTFTTSAAPIEVIAPTVTTLAATNVTYDGATLNGTITAGTETITAQGFRYKTSAAADWTEVSATGTTITATLTDLTAETAYEFKAFATTASGTIEGTVMTFTTSAAPIEVIAPVVTTMAATSVTSDGATLNGTIVAGNEEITAQGFIYKQDGAADWTTEQVAGENIAHTLTGLSAATTYRFKAFATTASGTVEGAEMSFTTLAGLADVENAAISAVIYPNPASERATLSLNGLNENAQIVLTDVQGRIILTDSLNAGAKTYELNVKSLASGVYYVRVIAGSTIATKKLIVE